MNVLNEKTISCRIEITSKIIKLYLLTESDSRKKLQPVRNFKTSRGSIIKEVLGGLHWLATDRALLFVE